MFMYSTMNCCLLCLEVKKEFVDIITVSNTQFGESSIKCILNKYLWTMNHIEASSWICITCWKELNGFHKFYMRIKKAHDDFGLFTTDVIKKRIGDFTNENSVNKKSESPIAGLEDNGVELHEGQDNEPNHFLNVCDTRDKQSISDLVTEEQKPIIKLEVHAETLTDSNILLQKRKRGRPRKNTCSNTNSVKAVLNKTNIVYKKRKVEEINELGEANKSNQNSISEIPIKEVEKIKENIATNMSNSEKVQECSSLFVLEEPQLTLCSNSEYNNEGDRESLYRIGKKSSINTNCEPKTILNEKDKFLSDNFKITCFLCNIPLETFFIMLKHFEAHHDEPGHVKCCNKKFYRRSILVDHVHYHLNPNYFKCGQCGKVMADRRCLELHIENHESKNERNHCCDICGKGFAKLGVLKKHRTIHLSEEEKRFSCSDCGKNFASNYLRSSHYRTVHLKKYAKICDICGKSIRCKDVFERHMMEHEGKTAPSISCDVCGLLLTDKKALKRHKDIIHPAGGQHAYTCSICSKTSPNLRAHKRHVEYKHLMGYNHKCTICDKAFKRAPTLKEHMASHTGTVLYTCPWCPKTFNSNANMHNHRKRIHPKEWEEASRKRYSGNLPPHYKPPTITEHAAITVPLEV